MGGMVKTLISIVCSYCIFGYTIIYCNYMGKIVYGINIQLSYYLIGHKLIFDLLTKLINNFVDFGDDWHLRTYTVMGSIAQFTRNIEAKNLTQPLLVCTMIMIIAIGASCFTLQKKDI